LLVTSQWTRVSGVAAHEDDEDDDDDDGWDDLAVDDVVPAAGPLGARR
jgi:hypothetical protein